MQLPENCFDETQFDWKQCKISGYLTEREYGAHMESQIYGIWKKNFDP